MNLAGLDRIALGGILILLTALVLSVGGLSLVLYSARMTREAISRRVDLVRGKTTVVARSIAERSAMIRAHPKGSAEREVREVAKLITKFGIASRHAVNVLIGVRLAAITILALAIFVVGRRVPMFAAAPTMPVILALAGGIVGWFIPAYIISRLVKSRAKAVVSGLPDALELLVICVEAGLAFEDGLNRVVGELEKSQPTLAEELALILEAARILGLPHEPSARTASSLVAKISKTRSMRTSSNTERTCLDML